jgi:hypothetical protein
MICISLQTPLVSLLLYSHRNAQMEVISVKNKLDPAHDAATSACYLDVALNLRVVCTAERRCGVDTHVCEVQLLLRPVNSTTR